MWFWQGHSTQHSFLSYGEKYIKKFILKINIDICDLLLWGYKSEMASYADDNIPNTSDVSLDLVFRKFHS